jgi:hypothetical protein
MIIKDILREELENSLGLKKRYEDALSKLPKGALTLKLIKGNKYYYLVYRVASRVEYKYLGKITEMEKKKYEEAKKMRAKYSRLLSQIKKQITFLRSSLRGKKEV